MTKVAFTIAALAIAVAIGYTATLLVGSVMNPEDRERVMNNVENPDPKDQVAKRNVAIFIHEGVELLDFSGPGEVFAAANRGRAFDVYTVAPTEDPIVSQGFVTIKPEYSINNCPPPDIIVLPGGKTDIPLGDPRVIEWIKESSSRAEISLSVCTGAFLLAKAGLLDGRQATTHWGSIEGLKTAAPGIIVRENERFVDSGNVITSAGVSAGIDGALHVVDRLLGREAAERTARYMEYNWQPRNP
ncbi:MAG TPA: DJ-1/PfpI family protein [Blastocatellia bacterium]|jgi:transcriptional regulator GlxA family with amidase domain